MNQYAFKTINHSSKCYNNFNLGKAKRSFASSRMQISTDRSHNKISSGNLFSVPNNLLFESKKVYTIALIAVLAYILTDVCGIHYL